MKYFAVLTNKFLMASFPEDSVQVPDPPKLPPKRLAEQMLDVSTLIDKQSRVYKLPVRKSSGCKSSARCYVGNEPTGFSHLQEKVLMVVGATGAGKSTLINGIVNYILGVRWDDPFRFKMIVDDSSAQTHGVTSTITAYTIYQQEGSQFPYTLTIVDTPGFGHTQGLSRDRQITQQMKEFLSIPPNDGGIDHIDGIGFVVQASLARLTHTQKYIFNSILSILGKDIGKNIYMMITFADGQVPPVVEAIKAGGTPFCKYFKFNNSALFLNVAEGEEDEDDGGDFDKIFWSMGMKSFGKFFSNFEHVEPRSLQLTREVLEERQRLEACLYTLQTQNNEGLAKIEEMRKDKKVMEVYEADIQASKEFKYKITVTRQRKVDLKPGQFVNNCLLCNFTCHQSCGVPDDSEKYRCSCMDGGGVSNAKCTVCPQRCGWRSHVSNRYRFELYSEEIERTAEDMKRRYDTAKQGKAKVQDLIRETESRLSQMDKLVMDMIRQVQRSLARLDEIALVPNPISTVEHIDLMIKSEMMEHKKGWDDRVQCLQTAKKQAQIIAGIRSQNIQETADLESLWTKMKN